jgi:hypothetical protein
LAVGSASASADHEVARADIDLSDAVDSIGIRARGDEAVQQLNAWQEQEGLRALPDERSVWHDKKTAPNLAVLGQLVFLVAHP